MARLEVGQKLPDFDALTKDGTVRISELVQKNTLIVFLRYLGCSLCQYELYVLKEHIAEIDKTGGQVIAVLQSAPETLESVSFPFTVISDEKGKIYKLLDIKPAESKEQLGGEIGKAKRPKIKELGFQHGKYEGEELQLPAVFGVTPSLDVFYVKYGVEAADTPSAEEIVKILSEA